jgi:hypothetical protein
MALDRGKAVVLSVARGAGDAKQVEAPGVRASAPPSRRVERTKATVQNHPSWRIIGSRAMSVRIRGHGTDNDAQRAP